MTRREHDAEMARLKDEEQKARMDAERFGAGTPEAAVAARMAAHLRGKIYRLGFRTITGTS